MHQNTHPPAIVKATSDLRIRARAFNSKWEAAQNNGRKNVEEYRDLGQELIKFKAEVGHGGWAKWVQVNLKCSFRSAGLYMQVAANWSKCAIAADLTEAVKLIGGGKTSKNPIPEELVISRRIESLIAFIDALAATKGKGMWYPELKPKLEECARTWQQHAGKVKEAVVELPKVLETKEFREEWENWIQHHREKQSRLSAIAIKKQLATLAEMGAERATKALDYSIRQCYHGIVEPGNGTPRGGAGRDAAAQRRTERRGRDFAEPDAPIPDPLASA